MFKLGLFDETQAMVKFQAWHEEHETMVRKRSDDHRKTQRTRKPSPAVKRVEPNNSAAGGKRRSLTFLQRNF